MAEVVVAVLVFGGLGVLPIVGLIIKVWRDHLGKQRNAQGRCYACGDLRMLFPLTHYRGETFNYCLPCSARQDRISTVIGLVVAGILIVGFCAWLVVRQL
jgi:hypothetical protein